jgi:hypothetical protein
MSRSGRSLALLTLISTGCAQTLAAQQAAPPRGATPGGPGGPGARAQVPAGPGVIAGVAVGAASGQPLPSAAVTIRSMADSALVGGALARADGSFRIEGLRPGRYTVRVRALGHAPLLKAGVVVTPDAPRVDLGRMALDPVAATLSAVQVEATRDEASLAPDRNAYSVKDMPTTSGGTAVDVLRNVPPWRSTATTR